MPLAPPPALEVRCITDEPAFVALHGEFNRLVEASPRADVFLRHEWFDAAWQWAKLSHELRVLTVSRGGELVGVCPLVAARRRRRGLPTTHWSFLTVPDTQYCDLIAAEGLEGAVAQAVADYLSRHAGHWDVLELGYLREGGVALRFLAPQFARRRAALSAEPAGANPVIPLSGGWAAFYATRGRRLKKSNNLVANRLTRAGELRLEWRRGDTLGDLDGLLAAVVGVSARSWKADTGFSLDRPGPGAFVTRLTELAAARGWLSVWLLTLDGETVAAEYQLEYRGRVYALRADFDRAREELSPGSYLNWKLLEQLFGAGLGAYYMGPGNNAYKARWTEGGEPVHRLTAFSPSLRGRGLHLLEQRLAPLARAARDRFRPAPAAPVEAEA